MGKMDFRKTNGKKKIGYIVCMAFCFLCVMVLKVHAAEDSGIFSAASAKIYTAMSEDSDVVANLVMGNMFEVLDAQTDASGVIWYQVRTDFSAEGYVKASELDRVLMPEPEADGDAQNDGKAQVPENAQAPENAAGEENAGDAAENAGSVEENSPENNADINEEPIGELIVQEAVNLRRMPSTGSEIMGRINRNTTLPYFEQSVNDAGEIWYRVVHEGLTGYVTDGAVTRIQQPSQPDGEEQTSAEARTMQTEPPPKPIQENIPAQEEIQSETETATADSGTFEVYSESGSQKTHGHRGFDGVMVALAFGSILCVAAIAIIIKKIQKLMKE